MESHGVIDFLAGEHALTSEITAIPTPGHTPGSMSLAVVPSGERAYIKGDVFHGPAQVTEPEWVFSFDAEPVVAVQTKTGMLERAESENATLAICHHSGFGKVMGAEGRRYWLGISPPLPSQNCHPECSEGSQGFSENICKAESRQRCKPQTALLKLT